MAAQGPAARGAAEGDLTGALRGLFAVVEAYPQLRASEHFQQLQTTLVQIEDAIQNARRYYNAGVRDYNVATAVFPSSIVAAAFVFTPAEFFELDSPEQERRPVDVAFS